MCFFRYLCVIYVCISSVIYLFRSFVLSFFMYVSYFFHPLCIYLFRYYVR